MTLDEKLDMVRGWPGDYVGNIKPMPQHGIPALHLEDGPQGVADGVEKTTCWPSALAVVSTWNPSSMHTWSAAMGREQRVKGTNIMLGPMINIARVPVGGRNFESFGEDPHLSSVMVVQSVKGIQSEGVMACAKHWVDNNQELNRTLSSATVDERTQHEIYFPAFKAAADAGVGSFMCSYNLVNGLYACENNYTLTTVLKQMWGYQGFVMSDWGATHSTTRAANSGLDMQMPDDSFFGAALKRAISTGQVTVATLDDKVLRILTSMFAAGLFDKPQTGNLGVDSRSPEHTKLARQLSAESTVLLKNDGGFLPFDTNQFTRVAVLGDDGDKSPTAAGDGSGHVIPSYIVSPLQGIKERLPSSTSLVYAPTAPLSKAVDAAKNADVAIIFVSQISSEGRDRENLSLPNGQDQLIEAVAAVQKNVIVVCHVPGAILMPWASKVKSILNAWMPGQEMGHAIADVIFGDVNPSAKLPVTFPLTETQTPLQSKAQYPGIDNVAIYTEKLLVGYRWYDAQRQNPLFPFGHGLSYTRFDYSDLSVLDAGQHVIVTFFVTNTGHREGAEVAQMYISFPSLAQEPPLVLRDFDKRTYKVGQKHHISFTIEKKSPAVSIWDVEKHDWLPIPGHFGVHVGSSSRDIRLNGFFQQQ